MIMEAGAGVMIMARQQRRNAPDVHTETRRRSMALGGRMMVNNVVFIGVLIVVLAAVRMVVSVVTFGMVLWPFAVPEVLLVYRMAMMLMVVLTVTVAVIMTLVGRCGAAQHESQSCQQR